MQKTLKITSVLKKAYFVSIYMHFLEICVTEIGLQLHIMKHYVFRYTIQEALTFNVWQLYEKMAGCPIFSICNLKGRSKMFQIAKRFWPLIFKVVEDKLKFVNYI